jgi:hypothetical protein
VLGVGIRDVLARCRLSVLEKTREEGGEVLQMRTARDENAPRFVVDKPRLAAQQRVVQGDLREEGIRENNKSASR